jgi:hypothetical protein
MTQKKRNCEATEIFNPDKINIIAEETERRDQSKTQERKKNIWV